jgi:NADH-quinone oxidoreductase subunit L
MRLSAEHLLWVILLLPLAAAALSALLFRRGRIAAPFVSCAAAAGVLAASLQLLLGQEPGSAPLHFSYQWLTLGSFAVNIGFLLDANAALMLFSVSFVAFWIHIFSIGYMDNDAARGRFFTGLSVFMFSILGIVLADNLYMTFVFWELVGFSSYMLIAHYFDKPDAVAASKKAFIANRIGDLGFLAGIVLCHATYGTVDLTILPAAAASDASTLIGILLMCGFIGKSAQFPLHVWLTDAMAGPTPVSALIHAATMVAAGVYFMARVFFLLTPTVLLVMLWSGAFMALLSAFCALAQTDIKKSLAYSTLSHLGFMSAALGLGLPEIALLHLATHAFFKATLFLCAGSVIHACHHEQDMTCMGGLMKRMPVTHLAFVLASLSLCAFPLTAGWVSKDAILGGALLGHEYPIFAILLLAALGSVLYLSRMWFLVFVGKVPPHEGDARSEWKKIFLYGEPNSHRAAHARESGPWMLLPLIILGLGGAFSLGGNPAAGELAWLPLPLPSSAAFASKYHALHNQLGTWFSSILTATSLALCIGGFIAAIRFCRKTPHGDTLRERHPRLYHVLEYRWCDTLYDSWIARIQQPLANAIGFLDTLLINGLAVRCIGAGLPGLLGLLSRRLLHTGHLSHYALWFALGSLFYGAFIILW